MVVSKQSYEECRRKRMEENKKRMKDLNLPLLAQSIQKPFYLKPSPMKQVKPRTTLTVAVRRSNRLANMPSPVFKEVEIDRVTIPRRIYKQRRDLSNRVYASDGARAEALDKAENLQSDLEPEYPNFVKTMLQSHVSGGFWLGLPVQFCRKCLPKRDDVITLINEDGDKYPTIYLSRKTGLSGGWKGFAQAHNLVDGDALVFQLITTTTFKVYIIRVKSPKDTKQF